MELRAEASGGGRAHNRDTNKLDLGPGRHHCMAPPSLLNELDAQACVSSQLRVYVSECEQMVGACCYLARARR